jgi:magnesium chelatase family protein
MNPCPAGRTCSEQACRCSPDQVRRYQGRISGPLLDRIDLHVAVPPVPGELLAGIGAAGPDAERGPAEPSLPEQCERIRLTQGRQRARQGCLNADLPGSQVARTPFEPAARQLLRRASERYRLSARGTHRVVRVARTIADLADARAVEAEHLGEALSYRAMDWDGGLGMAAF